jgi:hypothetical protein
MLGTFTENAKSKRLLFTDASTNNTFARSSRRSRSRRARPRSAVNGPLKIRCPLAARPRFFHNGSEATLADVVEFYNTRFALTAQECDDLIAFLRSL